MLFVALGKIRSGTAGERIARRMQWQYPEGAELVAEYWLQGNDPTLISVIESESITPIMAATSQWDDVFEFNVFPAVTAEEGMKIAEGMMAAAEA